MEECVKKIIRVVEKFRKLNGNLPEEVKCAVAEVNEPGLKLAVVGRFQVGKSHIVNQVFLHQNLLLQEGIGLCTTAVTTEVVFGTQPKLIVKYKNGDPDKEIINPRAEDIKAATSGDCNADRKRLADTIDIVRLEWPEKMLKNFTVYDTPGLDDPDQELLKQTTYRFIPGADVAVMVVEPKSLSSFELDFLRRKVFEEGIGRVMVLISYRPELHLPHIARGNIVAEIKNQLANIGRANIPVKLVCFDSAVTGDVLNTSEAILKEVTDYVRTVTLQNRLDKLALKLRKALLQALRNAQFRLALADKNTEELADMKQHYAELENSLRSKQNELLTDFEAALLIIKEEELIRLRSRCLSIADFYIRGFNDCIALSDAQQYLDAVGEKFSPIIENAVIDTVNTVRGRITEELRKYDEKLNQSLTTVTVPSFIHTSRIEIDGGFFSGIKSTLVTALDYLMVALLMPGGFLIGCGIRYVLGHIPVLRDLLPANIARGYLVDSVKESLKNELEKMLILFGNNMDGMFAELVQKISDAAKESIVEQNAAFHAAEDVQKNSISEQEISELNHKTGCCMKLLAQL